MDPGLPLYELPSTVILGVILELAGFRSSSGVETACWGQGEVKVLIPSLQGIRVVGMNVVFGTYCSFWETQKGMKGSICGVMLF